ncbi:hypothetical protein ABPG72_021507 [Tetrahymena utriculariae]
MDQEIDVDVSSQSQEQQEEKEPFEDLIQECDENTRKLEILYIQKENEYQELCKTLSDLQDQIWNHQKEEYEQNSINTDQQIKKEIEQLSRLLAEKEEKIETYEKEISNKMDDDQLVKMRSKYKEIQQHKEINLRKQYKTAISGEQEQYPALRQYAEELKHELDVKKAIKEKLDEEIKKSDESIKELRRMKRDGASQEHELQEEIENLTQR